MDVNNQKKYGVSGFIFNLLFINVFRAFNIFQFQSHRNLPFRLRTLDFGILDLKLSNTVPKFGIFLYALLQFFFMLLLFEELLKLQFLLLSLILLFDLLQLLFLLGFVAARGVLVAILMECFEGWLQVPYLFQKDHVLRLHLRLYLTLPEHPSRRFGLFKCGGHILGLLLPLVQVIIESGVDGFDGGDVLVVFILRLFVEEVVLVDGAGGNDERLHQQNYQLM